MYLIYYILFPFLLFLYTPFSQNGSKKSLRSLNSLWQFLKFCHYFQIHFEKVNTNIFWILSMATKLQALLGHFGHTHLHVGLLQHWQQETTESRGDELEKLSYPRPDPTCRLFLQIKLCWNTAIPIHLCIIYRCFQATMAESSSCNREHLACKV